MVTSQALKFWRLLPHFSFFLISGCADPCGSTKEVKRVQHKTLPQFDQFCVRSLKKRARIKQNCFLACQLSLSPSDCFRGLKSSSCSEFTAKEVYCALQGYNICDHSKLDVKAQNSTHFFICSHSLRQCQPGHVLCPSEKEKVIPLPPPSRRTTITTRATTTTVSTPTTTTTTTTTTTSESTTVTTAATIATAPTSSSTQCKLHFHVP